MKVHPDFKVKSSNVEKVKGHLEEIVWRAEMTESGISTARKTAMTTMSIMVVELASLCLRSRLSFVKPNIDILLMQKERVENCSEIKSVKYF